MSNLKRTVIMFFFLLAYSQIAVAVSSPLYSNSVELELDYSDKSTLINTNETSFSSNLMLANQSVPILFDEISGSNIGPIPSQLYNKLSNGNGIIQVIIDGTTYELILYQITYDVFIGNDGLYFDGWVNGDINSVISIISHLIST